MSSGVLVFPSPIWASPFPNSPSGLTDYTQDDSTSPAEFELPISTSDVILAQNLATTNQLQIKDQSGQTSIQLNSTTSPVSPYQSEDKINLKLPTDDQEKFSKRILTMLAASPAEYRGRVTPETLFGCHLVASRLQDQYDPTERRLVHSKNLRNDYLGIIAQEQTQGRTLIAMDKDWVLPLIAEYLQTDQDRAIHRTEDLREKIATYHPVTFMGEPYVVWENNPNVVRDPRPWSVDDLSIYALTDVGVGQIIKTSTWEEYDASVMMVFAPVNAEVAGAVNFYLYREIDRYAAKAYLAVKDLPVSQARDFEYLFPVELTYLRNYVVFSSLVMSRQDLVDAFYRQEVHQSFPRLDPKLGSYASFLLAESTFYQFPLFWHGQTLTIQMVGYIQAQDLIEQFTRLLLDIQSHGVIFQPLPDFKMAGTISSSTDAKCFLFEGTYYAAVPEKIVLPSSALEIMSDQDRALVELKGPLRSFHDYPTVTQTYLSALGYQVTPNPETYYRDLPLGYRTIQLNLDYGSITLTAYYYHSTFEEDIEIYRHEGTWSKDLFNQLQLKLNQGYFAGPYLRNLLQGYPDLVPSLPSRPRNLSRYPEKAHQQLLSS